MKSDTTPPIRPQLKAFRAQQAFERNLGRLRLELRLGTPRRHLDVLVELLEALLPDCGDGTLLTESYRRALHAVRSQIALRSDERVVRRRNRRSYLEVVK